jgi:hypothetical protein
MVWLLHTTSKRKSKNGQRHYKGHILQRINQATCDRQQADKRKQEISL